MIRFTSLRSVFSDRKGAVSVEFVIVLPLFITLTLGSITFLLLMSTTSAIHFASEDAARCAAIRKATCSNNTTTTAYATSRYAGPRLTAMAFAYSNPACGHRVTGSGSFVLTTGFGTFSVPVAAAACYPNQS